MAEKLSIHFSNEGGSWATENDQWEIKKMMWVTFETNCFPLIVPNHVCGLVSDHICQGWILKPRSPNGLLWFYPTCCPFWIPCLI